MQVLVSVRPSHSGIDQNERHDFFTSSPSESLNILVFGNIWQGRRLCVFKVFIEYPLNLGSCCISMISLNMTVDKTLIKQFCYFFLPKSPLLGYKCVSIQKWTWILSRQSQWSVHTELIISMRDSSSQLHAATPGVVGGAYSTRNLNIL